MNNITTMKRYHLSIIFLAVLTAMLSCEKRSELIAPHYPDVDTVYVFYKDTIYHKDTVFHKDTVVMACGCQDCASGTPVNPDAPKVETMSITVDFSVMPFSSDFPTKAEKSKKTYVLPDTEYSFTFYSPALGFYFTGTALRLVGKIVDGDPLSPGYILLPAVADHKLTMVSITGANATGEKSYVIYDKDPIDEAVVDEASLGSVKVPKADTVSLILKDPSVDKAYYLTVPGTKSDNNAQISKLVLTYTKQ